MSESLAKARIKACKRWPFATHAIMSLVPVRRNGLGTLSVDQHYRLYYDENVIRDRSDDENVFSLLHEVSHLLLRHHKRGRRVVSADDQQAWDLWNTAADCAVNSLLRAEGVAIPPNRAGIPDKYGLPWGQAAEAYFRDLMRAQNEEQQESQPEAGTSDDPQPDSPNSDEETPDSSCEPQDSPQSPEKSACDDDDSDSPDSGSDAGDAAGAFLGDDDAAQGDSVDENGDWTGKPLESDASGSCSDGRPRDWECPPPPEPDLTGDGDDGESDDPPGLDEYDQQIVIQKVAESLKSRGEGAGGWQEFVDEILEPKLDPRRLIMRAVSKHVENIIAGGNGRYSYRRPSRRPSNGGLIRPRSFQPIPRITLIIDTSGSMSSHELGVAVGLVSKVLDGLRLRDGLQVVCGDTQVQSAEKIFDPSKIKLAGRGGTDMRTLVTAAVEEKPKPDLILLVTDGWTPWPEQTKMPVVACVTPGGKTQGIPSHIETVQLNV